MHKISNCLNLFIKNGNEKNDKSIILIQFKSINMLQNKLNCKVNI